MSNFFFYTAAINCQWLGKGPGETTISDVYSARDYFCTRGVVHVTFISVVYFMVANDSQFYTPHVRTRPFTDVAVIRGQASPD